MAKAIPPSPESTTEVDEPLIIRYTNLLHQYRNPEAEAVQEFLRQHHDDRVFLERADVLNKVFRLKQELVPRSLGS